MQVDISLSLVELDKEVKIYIQRKLEIALSRTSLYITAISIVLSKKRSSENENDIHCILTLSIIDSPEVVIEDTQSNLYYVIDRAIQKAKRTMDRIVAQQF
ncbi:MAG: hypothetical protein COB83_11185 [Gammaproteobacteria bacterium]|nr:MAG: hypothetical protein COB83_11185 [Gammaproteobacteria bacterium]